MPTERKTIPCYKSTKSIPNTEKKQNSESQRIPSSMRKGYVKSLNEPPNDSINKETHIGLNEPPNNCIHKETDISHLKIACKAKLKKGDYLQT